MYFDLQSLNLNILFDIIPVMLNNMKSSNSIDDAKNKTNNQFIAVKSQTNEKPKNNKLNPIKKFWNKLNKKQRIFAGIFSGIVLILIAVGIIALTNKKPSPAPAVEAPKAIEIIPPKTTEPSRLTGLEVPVEFNKRTVTGVQIENSPEARPQSGLKDAGVIYEAITEGGITRFQGLFQDTEPEYVGPVRSVRPYYLDFIVPYDAGIAHVGGSGQALAEIRDQGIKDLDQYSSNNTGAYWRENSRYSPHNMYTSVAKLKEVEQQKGWTSNYQGFLRGGEDKASLAPNAKKINIRMSSINYNIEYNYDSASNLYLRSEGGKPHMDAKSNTQLSPKVLVVPVVSRSQNGIYSVYAINGSGKVFVFQNGTVTEGTWQKTDRKSQFTFTGTDGQPLKLAPGQTWVTLASSASDVAITP